MKKIRIAVVDDHSLFRRGLVSLLSDMPEFNVVTEAGNGQDALHVIKETNPDIVLLDVNMPIMNGLEALTSLRQANPEIKVLMLTISQNDKDLIGAIVIC
jgi:two-component system nitrate/nitrite response regulator NarL